MKPEFRKEYERIMKSVDDRFLGVTKVSATDVIKAHYLIASHFSDDDGEAFVVGPKDLNLLMSAVGRQRTEYGGREKWRDDYEKNATLFWGLTKNHAFHDGNKRTALLILLYYLHLMNRVPTIPKKEWADLAEMTAASTLDVYPRYKSFKKRGDDPAVRFLSDFIQRSSRLVDKKYRIVTFRQLDAIVKDHGFGLEEPSGNYIWVVQHIERKAGLFRRNIKKEVRKIVKIGFPRMTAQVNVKALKTVLRETGLTHEASGLDSQVIFDGVEPFEGLIDDYAEPLRKLKDR